MSRASVAARRARIERPEPTYPDLSHKQILVILSGLITSMFVSILSSTIVTNALPRISLELHGSEAAYTWVVAASLLTMTASTPIWGKLSDRMNRKVLMQSALGVFVGASIFAGFSQSMSMLIAARALQGIGSGGVMALSQIIIGAIIPARDRGKYSGYLGASFALATVTGPLIGGAIVDTIGWRGCFYAGLPFAVAAFILLQRTLHFEHQRRRIPIDYAGALLITSGVSMLLIWVSLAGAGSFGWVSTPTAVLVPMSIVLLVGAALAESQATDPIIPLELFRTRTVLLSVLASVFMGCAMVGASVFMGQYFQIAQGHSAVVAGLLTLPLVLGMFGMSLISGRLISATGKWKRYLLGGSISLLGGVVILSTLSSSTSPILIGLGMLLVGGGIGCTNQNLVLAVQNTVPLSRIGAGSATVSFFRSLGSASGLAALGAVMTSHLASALVKNFTAAGITVPPGVETGAVPDASTLDPAAVHIVQTSYASAISLAFTLMIPLIAIAACLILAIREVPLRTREDDQDLELEELADAAGAPRSLREPEFSKTD